MVTLAQIPMPLKIGATFQNKLHPRAYTRVFSWLKVASLGTDNSVFNLKAVVAVVATFNQEMAMVGAFSVIKNLHVGGPLFDALVVYSV